jgi:hypothetical protein
MKRYNQTESLTKENGKAVAAQHKKFGLGQERVADREEGEPASGGNSTIADTQVNSHPEIYYICFQSMFEAGWDNIANKVIPL